MGLWLSLNTHAAQYRLLPYLAAAYVLRIFNDYLTEVFYQFSIDTITGNNTETRLPELGMEIHAISSSCKPIAGWIMKDAIQECREACGGHGYLKVSGIGDIRNDHDANLTYEGENHVLIQQTSNWLLKIWPLVMEKKEISTPLESANFISDSSDILSKKFTTTTIDELCVPENLLSIYKWLVCYLLKMSYEKVSGELKSGKSIFWAKNDSQVYYSKNLAIAYIQHFLLQRMLITISNATDHAIKNVLTKLYLLYGLWSLEKHIPVLYQGEYARGPTVTNLIHSSILKLCAELKDDAVSLVDVIAEPDFILNSVLGASDGMRVLCRYLENLKEW
ncbi:hypothetical protein NQ318_008682 [Aromia moschata]|uniref:Acyl-CoA oxidase n=1 Tax=Aromia moschata TaxID=1265417 RepID=A0AAV8XK93_9CUCU|nr:hypothetical protein NQ318_008682 [Aromia moschata]